MKKGTAKQLIVICLLSIPCASIAVEQGHDRHQEMIEKKVTQKCGDDKACLERLSSLMNERYNSYREVRINHCKNDPKCKEQINKEFPKVEPQN